MKKERIITLFGILVVFVPMLGIPRGAQTVTLIILGLGIVLLSIEKHASSSKAMASSEGPERPQGML